MNNCNISGPENEFQLHAASQHITWMFMYMYVLLKQSKGTPPRKVMFLTIFRSTISVTCWTSCWYWKTNKNKKNKRSHFKGENILLTDTTGQNANRTVNCLIIWDLSTLVRHWLAHHAAVNFFLNASFIFTLLGNFSLNFLRLYSWYLAKKPSAQFGIPLFFPCCEGQPIRRM